MKSIYIGKLEVSLGVLARVEFPDKDRVYKEVHEILWPELSLAQLHELGGIPA